VRTIDEISGHLIEGERQPGVLLAHGAGAGQDHPLVTGLRDGLAARGMPILTFDYPYMARGRRRPDRTPVLMDTHRRALRWFREHVGERVVLAGRSMGGRIASMVTAEGESVDGLICYSYPLHPPGRFDRIRAEHLWRIEVPMLFFVGGRDAFARRDLVDTYLVPIPRATVKVVDGADHGLRFPKRSGMTTELAIDSMVRISIEWMESLGV
jgi:uncharacterized protein